MSGQVRESSIAYKDVVRTKPSHFTMPTWVLLIFLCVVFYVLKSFIYLKDEKRHGK